MAIRSFWARLQGRLGNFHVFGNSLNVEMTIFLVPAGGEVP